MASSCDGVTNKHGGMAVRFLGVRTAGMGSSAALLADDVESADAAPASSGCPVPVEQLASTTASGSTTKTVRIASLLPRAQVGTARSLPCALLRPTGDGSGQQPDYRFDDSTDDAVRQHHEEDERDGEEDPSTAVGVRRYRQTRAWAGDSAAEVTKLHGRARPGCQRWAVTRTWAAGSAPRWCSRRDRRGACWSRVSARCPGQVRSIHLSSRPR